MGAGGRPSVVAAHGDPVTRVVDAHGARALEEAHAAAEQLVLQRRRDLGILLGQHLLPGHDQGDVAPERAEHVDELHAGDTGADHHEVVGPHRRAGTRRGWRGSAGRPRSPSRAAADGCPVASSTASAATSTSPSVVSARTVCGPVSRPRPRMMRTPWLSSSSRTPCSSFCSMASMRAFSASGSTVAEARGEPHLRRPSDRRQRAARGDHRLRGDAVPQVGGAADHVLLDHRDLGPEAGGVAGRGVAGRSPADDHEAQRHGEEATDPPRAPVTAGPRRPLQSDGRAPQRPVPGDGCRRQPPRPAQLHRPVGGGRERAGDRAGRPPPPARRRPTRRCAAAWARAAPAARCAATGTPSSAARSTARTAALRAR